MILVDHSIVKLQILALSYKSTTKFYKKIFSRKTSTCQPQFKVVAS